MWVSDRMRRLCSRLARWVVIRLRRMLNRRLMGDMVIRLACWLVSSLMRRLSRLMRGLVTSLLRGLVCSVLIIRLSIMINMGYIFLRNMMRMSWWRIVWSKMLISRIVKMRRDWSMLPLLHMSGGSIIMMWFIVVYWWVGTMMSSLKRRLRFTFRNRLHSWLMKIVFRDHIIETRLMLLLVKLGHLYWVLFDRMRREV